VDDETLAAWRALLNAHAAVTSRVEAELAAAGLPPLGWYDVLWPLRRAPGRRLRMSALAAEVTLSRTGLTRLVDRMEQAGVVAREPAAEDRRGSYVTLTPDGAALLRRMWPVYRRALEQWFRPSDPATLRLGLAALAERANLGYNV
jgi:DNA-binding MarR family transcriptional regulator